MRALLIVLLLASTASAADPYLDAMRALSEHNQDPTLAIPALKELRPKFPVRDRAVVDRVIAAAQAKSVAAYADATSEFLRRWSAAFPDDVKIQEMVISTFFGLAMGNGLKGTEVGAADRPPLLDEALQRARALARSHPRDASAQRLLGSLLGAANQSPRESLTALGHCLEIDPKDKACQEMFSEISRYYLAPRCEAGLMRNLELRAGGEVLGRGSYLEVADPPNPTGDRVVVVRMAQPGRQKLAHLTAKLAKTKGELLVILDGETRVHLQIIQPLDKELVELKHLKLSDLCKEITTPTLPPALQKWAN